MFKVKDKRGFFSEKWGKLINEFSFLIAVEKLQWEVPPEELFVDVIDRNNRLSLHRKLRDVTKEIKHKESFLVFNEKPFDRDWGGTLPSVKELLHPYYGLVEINTQTIKIVNNYQSIYNVYVEAQKPLPIPFAIVYQIGSRGIIDIVKKVVLKVVLKKDEGTDTTREESQESFYIEDAMYPSVDSEQNPLTIEDATLVNKFTLDLDLDS